MSLQVFDTYLRAVFTLMLDRLLHAHGPNLIPSDCTEAEVSWVVSFGFHKFTGRAAAHV